LLEDRLFL
jgi:hypothetical protein